jgi:hypothetical protein
VRSSGATALSPGSPECALKCLVIRHGDAPRLEALSADRSRANHRLAFQGRNRPLTSRE